MDSLRHKLVSCILVFLCLTSFAGDPWRPTGGAAEAGMGYVCITGRSFWSQFHNQAALGFSDRLSAGFNYENRFGIRELGTASAGLIIPAGRASLGAVYSHFGYPDFRRHMAGIACGLKLSDKISAGTQLDYYSEMTYGEYDNIQALTFELGLLMIPADNIRLGIHLFNPVPANLRTSFLPSRIRAGAGIDLSSNLFAGVEAEMSTAGNLLVRTGFEYEAYKRLWLRGGFCTEHTAFSFGLGYKVDFIRLDLAFVTHESLGVSTSASIIFIMKN